MVSAHAMVEIGARDKAKKMTRNRIQAHSSNRGLPDHVTKVLIKNRIHWIAAAFLALWVAPHAHGIVETPVNKPAESLYLQLGQVGLDPSRVYQVRGAALNRGEIQISLDDGMIGFTQDVMGRITGAFFEGDGEILLVPPNAVERSSMSLFRSEE